MEQLRLADALGTFGVQADARPTITALRANGLGPTAIARQLNAQHIPTPTGLLGRWRPETVLRVENPAAWAAYMREYRRRARS